MIIMESSATREQIEVVRRTIGQQGLKTSVFLERKETVISLIGDEKRLSYRELAALPGVRSALQVEAPYKLISREYLRHLGVGKQARTIKVGDLTIGGKDLVFIAGPCAVENESQVMRIAEGVKRAGADILRGGVFKPRSSVHSFQGLGGGDAGKAEEALRWLHQAGREFGMPVVTEVRGENQIDLIAEYSDILQIGSRNMYDQDLLVAVARKKKPVFLKRHFGASVEEFLSFAEYIAAEGNRNILLCERGIIPMGKGKNYSRYTLDLGAVPAIKKETFLPIFVDPSHAMGRSDLIFNMSCAATAAGANGLMIEVHDNPAEAMVDGSQAITPSELKAVIRACHNIHNTVKPNSGLN